jgi:hypothetical protein
MSPQYRQTAFRRRTDKYTTMPPIRHRTDEKVHKYPNLFHPLHIRQEIWQQDWRVAYLSDGKNRMPTQRITCFKKNGLLIIFAPDFIMFAKINFSKSPLYI